MRFSLHDLTINGTVIYKETQSAITNALGLFMVNIGQGTPVTGTFAGINWGNGNKFMQVEIDGTGGTNYINMGTTQLMSVPYALYAAKSGNRVLGWLRFVFTGTLEVRDQCQVHVADIFLAHFVPKLSNGLNEGNNFDVANGSTNFCDDNIYIGAGHSADSIFNFISNVGNNLNSIAQILSTALFGYDVGINLTRGYIRRTM